MNIMKSLLSRRLYLAYLYYRRKTIKFSKGAGYYLVYEGLTKEVEMVSGYTVLAKFVYASYHRDPSDMIEYSVWEIIGFPGKTPIAECTKGEFIDIYGDYYYSREHI